MVMARIIYISSSIQSKAVLEELLKDNTLEVVGVITTPEKTLKSRGLARPGLAKPQDIRTFALEKVLKVFTPNHVKDNPELVEELRKLGADFIICAHYAHLIPPEILDLPRYGALNLHFSLLPAYRGPSPLEWTIAEGETITGISIMQMSPEFDTGKLVYQEVIPLSTNSTGGDLYKELFLKSGAIFSRIIPQIISGEITSWEQNAEAVKHLGVLKTDFYARKGTREDSRIDWNMPEDLIERRIRAFTPRPGAWTTLGELRMRNREQSEAPILNSPNASRLVKIHQAHLDENGKLQIDSLQVEGKKAMNWKDFENGYFKLVPSSTLYKPKSS